MSDSAFLEQHGVMGEESMSIREIRLTEHEVRGHEGDKPLGLGFELLRNMKVRMTASVGRCELTVKELFDLREGSVIVLDRDTSAPVDIILEGKVVARGMLVAVGDNFGVSITEITV
jgi:flagellar motor switch protein FliN/FliY